MLVRNRDYNEDIDDGVFLGFAATAGPGLPEEPIWFNGEGALVTVAPPGAGKGQSHIIPNLLTYRGPSIVLDIKGENHAITHEWRSQSIGPVFKFAPFDEDSNCYNPLDFMDHKDPAKIWDDARLAATMLMVQPENPDFWEKRALDLLTGIIALVKLTCLPQEQNMQTVLDLLHPRIAPPTTPPEERQDELRDLIDMMQAAPIEALRRIGNTIQSTPEKQREGIFDTVRSHLGIWQSSRIANITHRSDWLPEDFWRHDGFDERHLPRWRTLYISIPVGKVRAHASILRVIIGQHIRGLISAAPSQKQRKEEHIPPVLLLIDEMPQLGYMEPIREAIEVGRSYGLRMWMFTQSVGQLRSSYKDADGLMEMCHVQCFMNPDFDLAKRISDRLGYKEGLLQEKRKRFVEPQELVGPRFANKIVAFTRGNNPLLLSKCHAHADRFLSPRMGEF